MATSSSGGSHPSLAAAVAAEADDGASRDVDDHVNVLVIASAVLADFFDQNSPETIVTTGRMLQTLLQNAKNSSSGSGNTNSSDYERRRRVRLSNPKIQQHVVHVPGALDILGLAGFQQQEEVVLPQDSSSSSSFAATTKTIGQARGEGVLVYEPVVVTENDTNTSATTSTRSVWEMYLQDDDENDDKKSDAVHGAVQQSSPQQQKQRQQQQHQQEALIDTLCQGLQERMDQLQSESSSTKATTTSTTASATTTSSLSCLSLEERQRRQKKARALRQSKQQERELEQQRWLQDKQQRQEKVAEQQQKQQQKQQAAQWKKRQLPASSASTAAVGQQDDIDNGDDHGNGSGKKTKAHISMPSLAKPLSPAASAAAAAAVAAAAAAATVGGQLLDPSAGIAHIIALAQAHREKWLQQQQQQQQNEEHEQDYDDDDEDYGDDDEDDDDDGDHPMDAEEAAYYAKVKDMMEEEQQKRKNDNNTTEISSSSSAVVAPKKKPPPPPPPSQHVPLSAVVAAIQQQQQQQQGPVTSTSSGSDNTTNHPPPPPPKWSHTNINATTLGKAMHEQILMMSQMKPSTNGSGIVGGSSDNHLSERLEAYMGQFKTGSLIGQEQPAPSPMSWTFCSLGPTHQQQKQQQQSPRFSFGPTQQQQKQQPSPTTRAPPLPPATFETDESWSWEQCLQHLPRCEAADGIRETSVYSNGKGLSETSPGGASCCLKHLFKELDSLNDSLPTDSNSSIWIRFDEETPQFLRALMAAPLPGPTPYSGGMFVFDIYIPGDYPAVPPKVTLCTTGGGRVRFGPNLYANGKVCLSLLGTWSGPKWNPKHSSLYQVLISIQGLILGVEHPYFLEPGHGGWEGTVKEGQYQLTSSKGQTLDGQVVEQKVEMGVPQQAVQYEDTLRIGSVKFAMMDILKSATAAVGKGSMSACHAYLKPFYLPIQAHFYQNRNEIVKEVHSWQSDSVCGRKRSDSKATLQIDQLGVLLPKLQDLLAQIELPKIEGVAAAAALPSSTIITNPVASTTNTSIDGDSKKPAALKKVGTLESNENENDGSTGNKDLDVLEPKRARMREAAQRGDYETAGELQGEISRVEDVYRKMQEAAKQQDYMRAGRLQAQLKSLTGQNDPPKASADVGQKRRAYNPPHAAGAPGAYYDDYEDDYDDDYYEDEDDNDYLNHIPPPFAFPGLGNMLLGGPPPPSFMGPYHGVMGSSIVSGLGPAAWMGGSHKPLTGYALFSSEHIDQVKLEHPGISFNEVAVKVGKMWKELSVGERMAYYDGKAKKPAPANDGKSKKPAPGPSPPPTTHGFGVGLGPIKWDAATGPPNPLVQPPETINGNMNNILSSQAKKGEARKATTWGGGAGVKLGNDSQSANATAQTVASFLKPTASQPKSGQAQTIPPGQICRLRIRLPNNKTVLEDFDKKEPLSAVYRRLQPMISDPDNSTLSKTGMLAPKVARAGAFAQPLSTAGFTLLLTYPKREFSLEIHGTKTLLDLNLAPSATLTVMRCSDRGVMHRGELEKRLQEAQGDAIDLDGLTYEGLVELTDRVGVAGPGEGDAFLSLSAQDLDKNSTTFSPAFYLSEPDSERHCPVCLGSYDATDETATLRRLHNCAHVFHTACVETWLKTKASCPLCKTSVVAEVKQP